LSNLANYFHTLRHLRAVQIFGRARFALCRPPADERAAPPLRAQSHALAAVLRSPPSMLGPERFCLLNVEGVCAEASDWQGRGHSLLWSYNLHYFDDLNAADSDTRRAWHERLIERWIEENPPGKGVGWDSYPVCRRIVNWIKWLLAENVITPAIRQSLAVQARWLSRRIESHLQGNHVAANAKALVHAGLFFSGKEAVGWLRQGLRLMDEQIAEQVLSDGGHFERSPMYHAAFVEDLLDTLNIMRAYGQAINPLWRETVARMVAWLASMCHPDSRISFFNDAAFGVSPDLESLRGYAARLNLTLDPPDGGTLRLMLSSGYVSVDSPPFFLICDVAPVGPDHLPAHAHADTLSFELSCEGRRVFVNSGTSEYGIGPERQRQRGTPAHNTLVLDGENSSEVWAGFRVARRARARLVEAETEGPGFVLMGEHDGYRRLSGRNLHRRRWAITAHEVRIDDTVEGRFRSAECYFHLHPDVQIQRGSGSFLCLSDAFGARIDIHFEGAAAVHVVNSTWHPQFGLSLASHCIVVRLGGPHLTTRIQRAA
jgi:uncharacterized heparinase superfamily protein